VRFEVLTGVTMQFTVFLDLIPCSLIDRYRSFRGSFGPYLQGNILH